MGRIMQFQVIFVSRCLYSRLKQTAVAIQGNLVYLQTMTDKPAFHL